MITINDKHMPDYSDVTFNLITLTKSDKTFSSCTGDSHCFSARLEFDKKFQKRCHMDSTCKYLWEFD